MNLVFFFFFFFEKITMNLVIFVALLTCCLSGEVVDVSEASKKYFDEHTYPTMVKFTF